MKLSKWLTIAVVARWLVLQIRRPEDTMTDAQFCQMQRELDWIDRGANCSPTACRRRAALGIDDSQIKRVVLEWGDVTPGGQVMLVLERTD
jgi:hypothetical protein